MKLPDYTVNCASDGKDGVFATIQGEGKYTGTSCVFVRLSGCNLRCAWQNPNGDITLCDTPHTSFNPERNIRKVDEIVKQVNAFKREHVVISGGEPFLQKNLVQLIYELKNAGHFVTVETNGTIFFPTEAHLISISPKLSSSCFAPKAIDKKLHERNRENIFTTAQFLLSSEVQLKFVVNELNDIEEILRFNQKLLEAIEEEYDRLGVLYSKRKINEDYINERTWLMPQGISIGQFDEKTEWILQECNELRFNYSDRLHIRLFGNKKGV